MIRENSQPTRRLVGHRRGGPRSGRRARPGDHELAHRPHEMESVVLGPRSRHSAPKTFAIGVRSRSRPCTNLNNEHKPDIAMPESRRRMWRLRQRGFGHLEAGSNPHTLVSTNLNGRRYLDLVTGEPGGGGGPVGKGILNPLRRGNITSAIAIVWSWRRDRRGRGPRRGREGQSHRHRRQRARAPLQRYRRRWPPKCAQLHPGSRVDSHESATACRGPRPGDAVRRASPARVDRPPGARHVRQGRCHQAPQQGAARARHARTAEHPPRSPSLPTLLSLARQPATDGLARSSARSTRACSIKHPKKRWSKRYELHVDDSERL